MITYKDLADWIIQNRTKGKAFVGYSYEKIMEELIHCSQTDTMFCVSNGSIIVGVVCAIPDNFKKILHVYDVLTTEKGAFNRMITQFKKQFPDFSIQASRKNGKLIAYNNIDRLFNLTK